MAGLRCPAAAAKREGSGRLVVLRWRGDRRRWLSARRSHQASAALRSEYVDPSVNYCSRQFRLRMTVQEQVDRAHRVAYRLAYPVVQRLRGLLKLDQFVALAVWLDDTVLGVRHSY